MTTLPDFILFNRELFHKHQAEFKTIFHINLKDYFDFVTGFDVVKFDNDFIKPPDGISTNDAVINKYGQRAADLCHELIGLDEWRKNENQISV